MNSLLFRMAEFRQKCLSSFRISGESRPPAGVLKPGGAIPLRAAVLTFGRAPQCEIRINQEGVSRIHARLLRRRGGWWLCDAGSVHGTWLREGRVAQYQLAQGEPFRIGQAWFALSPDQAELLSLKPSGNTRPPLDQSLVTAEAIGLDSIDLLDIFAQPRDGSVHRATHRVTGRRLAVRISHLPPTGSLNNAQRSQLAAGLARARTLDHPACVAVLGGGFQNWHSYVVEDYPGAQTLSHRLNGRPIPFALVRGWALEVCGALSYLRRCGLIHAGMCGDNIWLDHNAKAVLSGSHLAQPAATAPHPGADINDLARITFHALTGSTPLEFESQGALPPPHRLIPSIPRLASEAILHAIHARPTHAEALFEIKRLMTGFAHPDGNETKRDMDTSGMGKN